MQSLGENMLSRFGKQIMLVYSLLGVVIVAWTFNESISFLESIGIVLYVAGVIMLRRAITRPNSMSVQGISPEVAKFDKAKTIKDILMIIACFAAVFAVMVVGTLASPKTKTGFVVFFEAPIVILAFIIIALIGRISFRLLNLKRYFKF